MRVSPPPEYPGGPLTPTPLGSNANAAFLLRQQFAANGTSGVLGSIRFQGPGVQAAVQAAAAAAAGQTPYVATALATATVPLSNPTYAAASPNLVGGVQLTQQQLQHADNNIQQQQATAAVNNVVINSPIKNNHRT